MTHNMEPSLDTNPIFQQLIQPLKDDIELLGKDMQFDERLTFPERVEQCVQTIAEGLKQGKPLPEGFDNVNMKDSFFAEFRDRVVLTPAIVEELKKIEPKIVSIKGPLQKLDIDLVKHFELIGFQIRNIGLENYGDDIHFDMNSLLNEMLSSSYNLRTLDLQGVKIPFFSHWLTMAGERFITLKTLRVSHQKLNISDFYMMNVRTPNLESLEITQSHIPTLEGIHCLFGLKSLSFHGCTFERVGEIGMLAGLLHLEMLDLSGTNQNNVNHVQQLLEGWCFSNPSLTYLDCSYNVLDENILKMLVKAYPRLRKIAILGTDAQATVLPDIELLKDTNLEELNRSLDHFFCDFKNEFLVSKIQHIINQKTGEQTKKELDETVKILFKVMIHDYGDLQLAVLEFLKSFARTHKISSTSVKQEFINSIAQSWDLIARPKPATLLRQQWSFLRTYQFLRTPGLRCDRILREAFRNLNESLGSSQYSKKVFTYLLVMSEILKTESNFEESTMKTILDEAPRLAPFLLKYFSDQFHANKKRANTVISLLVSLTYDSKEFCQAVVENDGIEAVMLFLEIREVETMEQLNGLLVLRNLACNLWDTDYLHKFYEGNETIIERILKWCFHYEDISTVNATNRLYVIVTIFTMLVSYKDYHRTHSHLKYWKTANSDIQSMMFTLEFGILLPKCHIRTCDTIPRIPYIRRATGPICWAVKTLNQGLKCRELWMEKVTFNIPQYMEQLCALDARRHVPTLIDEIKVTYGNIIR